MMKQMPNSRFQRQGGFTMVELVVSLAIFSLMSVAVLAMLNMTSGTYRDNTRDNYGKMLAQNAQAVIVDTVRYAASATIVSHDRPSADNNFHTEDGRLYQGSQPVFDESMYKNMELRLEFVKEDDTLLGITVYVDKDKTAVYQMYTAVKLCNLPLNAQKDAQVIRTDAARSLGGQSLSFVPFDASGPAPSK